MTDRWTQSDLERPDPILRPASLNRATKPDLPDEGLKCIIIFYSFNPPSIDLFLYGSPFLNTTLYSSSTQSIIATRDADTSL